MRRKTEYGICRICGKRCELTFEHVPPQAAFNKQTVDEIPHEEVLKLLTEKGRMPWDTQGLKKIKRQGGVGSYVLCQSCNNNTGSWYAKEYIRFTNTIAFLLTTIDIDKSTVLPFQVNNFQPLPIFKEIMTMFCDINNDCFGDKKLRRFLLNKEDNRFDKERYRVYAYVWRGGYARRAGFTGLLSTSGKAIYVSEIANFPLGLILHINPPPNSKPNGFEITNMVDFKYYDKVDMLFELPINYCNTPIPQDFREKGEIHIIPPLHDP